RPVRAARRSPSRARSVRGGGQGTATRDRAQSELPAQLLRPGTGLSRSGIEAKGARGMEAAPREIAPVEGRAVRPRGRGVEAMSEAARDWSASHPEPARPMRIEFATSELEGGPCRAWADPSVVLGAIAVSDPSDGFTKLVQPRLEELDAFGQATGGELPPIVTQLIDQLQKIHARMVREHPDAPATIALTCAAVEEDRVYFVKTCPT